MSAPNKIENREVLPGKVLVCVTYETHNEKSIVGIELDGGIVFKGALLVSGKDDAIQALNDEISKCLTIKNTGQADLLEALKLVVGYAMDADKK